MYERRRSLVERRRRAGAARDGGILRARSGADQAADPGGADDAGRGRGDRLSDRRSEPPADRAPGALRDRAVRDGLAARARSRDGGAQARDAGPDAERDDRARYLRAAELELRRPGRRATVSSP